METKECLSTMLIFSFNHFYLMPSVGLAEVLPFTTLYTKDNMPSWYLGNLQWRGITVPIVDMRLSINALEVGSKDSLKIAIINALFEGEQFSYFGIVISRLPKNLQVRRSDLHAIHGQTPASVQMKVNVMGVSAWIPDIAFITREVKFISQINQVI